MTGDIAVEPYGQRACRIARIDVHVCDTREGRRACLHTKSFGLSRDHVVDMGLYGPLSHKYRGNHSGGRPAYETTRSFLVEPGAVCPVAVSSVAVRPVAALVRAMILCMRSCTM